MEQVAEECRVNLVAYTITHHTRQSAMGLPFITEKTFDGRRTSVTEYTMSEIVASVYEKIEETGIREGILFLDEINCVSETLAPAMLQFLQCKSFGTHRIPEGWLIAAAGNPPEYNRSVREFDVVTLDRVKKIEVEPDFAVWKEYAYQEGIHQAVIAYLTARPGYFYQMESTVDGRYFATPRGWEDLSSMLKIYEKLGKPMDAETAAQYIQFPRIARDFAAYLELYRKYEGDYQAEKILEGQIPERLLKKAAAGRFDEKLSIVSLLISGLNAGFRRLCLLEDSLEENYETLKRKKAAGQGDSLEYAREKEKFLRENQRCQEESAACGEKLEHAFDFVEAAFGPGEETAVFVTELSVSLWSVRFLQEYDCERYSRYSRSLLLAEGRRELRKRILELRKI